MEIPFERLGEEMVREADRVARHGEKLRADAGRETLRRVQEGSPVVTGEYRQSHEFVTRSETTIVGTKHPAGPSLEAGHSAKAKEGVYKPVAQDLPEVLRVQTLEGA